MPNIIDGSYMTSRRHLNQIRRDIGAITPDKYTDPLPPQPSILQAELPNSLHLRAKRKILKLFRQHFKISSKPSSHLTIFVDGLPYFDTPKVSIVIPVYNNIALTVACLDSVVKNVSNKISYEVIVVDNNSSDETKKTLSKIKNLVYIRLDKNCGFVDGCNLGADHTRGKYLVFLNNDALVTTDWLESLVTTIESSQDIGLVGSKILYPDGRLQEAGGIIYQNGTGCNYGKNDHPDRYQYNYLREVDYCSGASIIIARSLFKSFGGFDTLYAPAYYEDTDLAFKVHAEGLRVLYQPESIIYHIEGATAGVSTSSGFKKYQTINQKKFLRRWKSTLQKNHYAGDLFLPQARDYGVDKRILIVDECIPSPDQDSGSVRMTRIIDGLLDLGYKVTFFPNYTKKQLKYVRPLQQKGVEVIYGEVQLSDILFQDGSLYNAVILSRPRIGSYYLDLCQAYCPNAKIIYDTVDLHYLRLKRQADFEEKEKKKYFLEMAKKHEVVEKYLIREADTALVVSQAEVKILSADGFDNIAIVSNIHEINESAYSKSFDNRRDLLFVGGFQHHPNVDGIRWLVKEVFPKVKKDLPDIQLHVVGSVMSDELKKELSSACGVVVHGYIEDAKLHSLLKKSRVFVAPLRYGAGVKGKIGQAIEYGVPIVSTSIGGEGMFLKNNKSYLRADNPSEFSSAIIKLYTNKTLWCRIQKNARNIIDNHFSAAQAKKSLSETLATNDQ